MVLRTAWELLFEVMQTHNSNKQPDRISGPAVIRNVPVLLAVVYIFQNTVMVVGGAWEEWPLGNNI